MLLIGSAALNAQVLSREFGKIDKTDLDYPGYPTDKSAPAVVLFDIGMSWFQQSDDGFDVMFEKTKRVKIFSEAGLKWSEVEIPFYQEGNTFEDIISIEAYTYNPVGDSYIRTQLNPSTCHDEKLNNSWQLRKFAFPDVKPGSVIEYKYVLKSPYKFNLRNWQFQSTIPTVFSEYVVKLIPFYEYQYVLQGGRRFDESKTYDEQGINERFGGVEYNNVVYKFNMKNIPAYIDEEYTTSSNDYIIKLDFQLKKIHRPDGTDAVVIARWPDLIETLVKEPTFSKFAGKCGKLLPKLVPADSLSGKNNMGKFNYIVDYVKSNFTWNKTEGKYSTKSPNDLIRDKTGNTADLNLFLAGLLDAAGIKARPVILSTRDNGKIKTDYPLLAAFNYVIISAQVDGQTILTDATDPTCPNDYIPAKCLNGNGLVIDDGPEAWINLQNERPSSRETTFQITTGDNKETAIVQITASGYDGSSFRRQYGNDIKKLAARINTTDQTVDESSISVSNLTDRYKPYQLGYSMNLPAEIISNKIYISPFPGEIISENPLKQESRTYPIDMSYPIIRKYISTILIPEGYQAEFIPAEEKMNNELFDLGYNYSNEGGKIVVTLTYSFKKSLYPASDYYKLKYIFKEVIKKGSEKVVLVRKG